MDELQERIEHHRDSAIIYLGAAIALPLMAHLWWFHSGKIVGPVVLASLSLLQNVPWGLYHLSRWRKTRSSIDTLR